MATFYFRTGSLSNCCRDLNERCQQIYNAFPAQLHYYEEGHIPKLTTGAVLYEQAYVMLQYLQNIFLLHRVALARGFSNGQGLLGTAMEMLDISLMFWIKRDQLMLFSSGFDWIVSRVLSRVLLLMVTDNILRYSLSWVNLC